MGELNYRDAQAKKEHYISVLTKCKKNVREDFNEMDFENAVQRNELESHVEGIERELDGLIATLSNMYFG